MELKHWAAYLPYGLKVKIDLHFYKNHEACEVVSLSETDVELANSKGDYIGGTFELCDVTPILRPMSHLTKEIEHKGEKFVPIVELLKLKDPVYFERTSGTRYAEIAISSTETKSEAWVKYMAMKEIKVWHDNPSEKPHWLVEKLREWHFDTDGLIEKGEAIAKE